MSAEERKVIGFYLNYISPSSPAHLIPSYPTLFMLVEAGHCRSLQNNEWGRGDMKLRLKVRDESQRKFSARSDDGILNLVIEGHGDVAAIIYKDYLSKWEVISEPMIASRSVTDGHVN